MINFICIIIINTSNFSKKLATNYRRQKVGNEKLDTLNLINSNFSFKFNS